MVDPDRRPSAQEIEELIDLVKRDPTSPASFDLGEAYLALGRPRDAAQMATLGLEYSPDHLEGRVLLARAYAQMHQWKEAQGELLRVVKVDRSSRQGFALLGEVLLRRLDFERAVPVLQHAQNLDPTSPHILSMLRRARAGQPLDPAPPPPTPLPPRGETDNAGVIQRGPGGLPGMVPSSGPAMPTMAIQPPPAMAMTALDQNMHQAAASWPGAVTVVPPAPIPPPMHATPSRGPKQTAPPPMSVEGIRPRIVPAAKVQNAAAASLRQSAAVGENYLNDLLTGGLLDVAGVRVPDMQFDLRPDRRWGRSTRRMFVFLFVVMVVGLGGGGTFYWWSEKQKGIAVVKLQQQSRDLIGQADIKSIDAAMEQLRKALEKDNKNLLTFAYVAEVHGLSALLYGTETDKPDRALAGIDDDIQPGMDGAREMLIGRAAVELSRITTKRDASKTLADVNAALDAHLTTFPDDKWARYLRGKAMLAAGERTAARGAFAKAAEGENGLVVAMVEQADLLVDDGDREKAMALYEQADKKSKNHPLVILGRSIANAEFNISLDDAVGELNNNFTAQSPPRALAYQSLGLAIGYLNLENYFKASDFLKKALASPPGDARFWSRVAWLHYSFGDLTAAADATKKVVYIGKAKPEVDPTVQLIDAGLQLASGLPDRALDLAANIQGLRPKVLRAYAYLDLGKAKDASDEIDKVLEIAPANAEAKLIKEHARVLLADAKQRVDALDKLAKLARNAKTKLGRHTLGVAALAVGDTATAKEALTTALTNITPEEPNPLAYRTHTAMAELALRENNLVLAGEHLDKALAINPGFFPTLALQARVVLKNNQPERALALLAPILEKPGAVTTAVELTHAEALAKKPKASADDKAKAKAIVTALKAKVGQGVDAVELARIAALIDPALVEQLELQAEAGAEADPKEPPKDPKKDPKKAPKPARRGRR